MLGELRVAWAPPGVPHEVKGQDLCIASSFCESEKPEDLQPI